MKRFIIKKKIKFGGNGNVTYICVTKANNMITVKDIIQGTKIETKVGVIEIIKIEIIDNLQMVTANMNGNKYRNEISDLVAFINENI